MGLGHRPGGLTARRPAPPYSRMIDKEDTLENYAGMVNKDKEIADELRIAKIEVNHHEFLRDEGEVKTSVRGILHGWSFFRAWYYWVAKGPGIPPKYADELHKKHGEEVRVSGHCGCPSPKEWLKGFAVGCYHVDTQLGLCALADTIRQIVADNLDSVQDSNLNPPSEDVT